MTKDMHNLLRNRFTFLSLELDFSKISTSSFRKFRYLDSTTNIRYFRAIKRFVNFSLVLSPSVITENRRRFADSVLNGRRY